MWEKEEGKKKKKKRKRKYQAFPALLLIDLQLLPQTMHAGHESGGYRCY
jgi:hypothetical protein